MIEYEVRFFPDVEIERRIEEIKSQLVKIKDYEFIDFYFTNSEDIARIRKWFLPYEKTEIIKTNYIFGKGKKGNKVKIQVKNIREGFDILSHQGFKQFIIVKKENGNHYYWKVDKRIRIALEKVYFGKTMEELKYFGKMGEIEVIAQNDEEAENLIDKSLNYFKIENYTNKSLLEILIRG